MSDSYFDEYAATYDRDLERALSVSGEDKNYFAAGRMSWLGKWLASHGLAARRVLDFGCGTGSATPFIEHHLHPEAVLGVDVSADSLNVAREQFASPTVSFDLIQEPRASQYDVAFCNGVFHHIDPDQRQQSLAYVAGSLQSGGIFALFENNPWNPATRYVMSRCAFDRDAITLSPPETQRRMREAGFEILTTRYLFIFPALLKSLRFMEQPLSPLPFGTQYVVIGRKS